MLRKNAGNQGDQQIAVREFDCRAIFRSLAQVSDGPRSVQSRPRRGLQRNAERWSSFGWCVLPSDERSGCLSVRVAGRRTSVFDSAAARMSDARISPPGPDPRRPARSTPCSLARRRAFGEILAGCAGRPRVGLVRMSPWSRGGRGHFSTRLGANFIRGRHFSRRGRSRRWFGLPALRLQARL